MTLIEASLDSLVRAKAFRAFANIPVMLDDPETCYLVTAGQVMLFSAELHSGRAVGSRRYIATLGEGTVLFGVRTSEQATSGLMVIGGADTTLASIAASAIEVAAADPLLTLALVAGVDAWVLGLSSVFDDHRAPAAAAHLNQGPDGDPAPIELAVAAASSVFSAGQTGVVGEGVLWIQPSSAGLQVVSADAGAGPRRPAKALQASVAFPLSSHSSAVAEASAGIETLSTESVLSSGRAMAGVAALGVAALAIDAIRRTRDKEDKAARLLAGEASDATAAEAAAVEIADVLTPQVAAPAPFDDPVGSALAALRLVGDAVGFAVVAGQPGPDSSARDVVKATAKTSRIRLRRVRLVGAWYRDETFPMVAFTTAGTAVAVIATAAGDVELVDPARRSRAAIDEVLAGGLQQEAFTFYLGVGDLAERSFRMVRFGLGGSRRDLQLVIMYGAIGGLLGLFPPLAAKAIFNSVIPAAAKGRLLALVVALIAAAVAGGLFQIVRGIAQTRLESRGHYRLESATWDRLLRLPPTFFRDHSVGDLAMRAQAVSTMREMLAAIGVSGIITSLFSLFTIGLLFYLSVPLALLGLVLLVPAVLSTVLAAKVLIRRNTLTLRLESDTNGLVVQLLSGLPKLRTAAAEVRAFSRWAHAFAAQRRATFRQQAVSRHLAVFNATFPAFTILALFATIIVLGPSTISPGTFVAFSAAYASFVVATLGVTMAIGRVVSLVPVFERTRPIFDTSPEVDDSKEAPGQLSGAIDLAHVNFRYDPEGPLVTDDVTLHVEAGEYIAFVGPSGSGKSSIMRLLLGFETPESGAVFYDNHDLAILDVEGIRRQIGVVLQAARLAPGSVYSNIAGSFDLTPEQAWDAAERAGLAADIRAMPMGMETVVSEGGTTFSGGQKQRLMIARAIAANPRILLFDEATSALDNATQRTVTESLTQLNVTRIVIAHRLSTVTEADRIIVLERGRIIQSGTYDELMGQPGLFADLAARQLA